MRFAIPVLIVALLLQFAAAAWADTYVRDGDTIVVSNTPIRLKGLSCPELGQPGGQDAKRFLSNWLANASEIECDLTGETTYDREVGWCKIDGNDIGFEMIMEGLCEPCRRYDTDGRYAALPVDELVPSYCN